MPRGTIIAFDKARGSGSVRLETGEELHFDASVLTSAEVRPGQAAEVVTGLTLGAKLRARLVLVERDAAPPVPFAEGFDELQLLGMLSAWTLDEARAAADGATEFTLETSGRLLHAYYGTQGRSLRSHADRVAVLDEHFGDTPRIPVDDLVRFSPAGLHEQLADALRAVRPLTLNNVLTAFNAVLQDAKVGQHYFLFDVASDSFAVAALRNDAFARSAHGHVLNIVT